MRFGSLRKKEKVTDPEPTADASTAGAADSAAGGGMRPVIIPPSAEEEAKPTTNSVLDSAIEVRTDTIQSLKRTEGTLKLAEESGMESMKTLAHNDEVLKRAEAIADQMEVKTFKGEIESMGRRLGRDKCFVVLSVLVVAMIVVAIVMPLVKPHLDSLNVFAGTPASNSSATPAPGPYGPGELEGRHVRYQ